jgi:hypothetical protein
VIDVLVTAKNGQKAMITFLKDSKDLVEVDYNSNVVQTETNLNSSK